MYDSVKLIHIASISMMFGVTMGNGVLHLIAKNAGLSEARMALLRGIMAINRRIMAPSFIGLILSGLWMAYWADLPFSALWLWLSITLTTALVIGFIYGYTVEHRLEIITQEKLSGQGANHAARYKTAMKIGVPIGASAAAISLIIMYLMITKPY